MLANSNSARDLTRAGKKHGGPAARAALILNGIILAGLLVLALWPWRALTLRLPREEGRLVWAILVVPGDPITLAYRHSVEKGRVKGEFTVGRDGRILVKSTSMDSVGTGLPNTEKGRRQGEWMVVEEGGKPLDEGIRFFLSPINQTRVTAGNANMPLAGLKPGSLLLIDVESIRLWRYALWSAFERPWPAKEGVL